MGSDWSESTLEELSCSVSYGYTESASSEKVGPHFLRITDIQNGTVDWENVPYCPISENDHQRYKLRDGDIVVARTGNSTGENYIFSGDSDAVFASYLIRFRIDEYKSHPNYVWYTMRSTQWWEFINGSKTGSAQAGANAKVLGRYPIRMPPLAEQKAIAHILGSLDDKIELNRRMNATLEGMAQALFKSWFVDFDPVIDNALVAGNPIPEELAERAEVRRKALADGTANREAAKQFPAALQLTEELGWIPEGWDVKQLSNFGKIVTGKTPPKAIDNAFGENSMFLTPTDYNGDILTIETTRRLSTQGEGSIQNSRIEKDSICVTCIGSQMGRTTLLTEKAFTNQQINSIYPRSLLHRNYILINMRLRRDEIFAIGSSGSTMPIVNKGIFSKLPILKPNEDTLKMYNQYSVPILDNIKNNIYQIKTLNNLRDTLLPKLISGELRIPEAEKITEEALA